MKRFLSTAALTLGIYCFAWAQPTTFFPLAAPCTNESICLPITVRDFTDILAMEYTITWDPTVISLEGVQGFNLEGLGIGNFDVSRQDEGILIVKWELRPCTPDARGVTIPDFTKIYELCFTARGNYGQTSPVRITNEPVDIRVVRAGLFCPNNIGMLQREGLVSTCVRPLELKASNVDGNPGDLVCVDVAVSGFDNMTSMQFSMNWDPDVIQFQDLIIPNNLVNLSKSGFGTPADPSIGPGNLTVSWAFVDPSSNAGVSLPDGTVIFQICYRIVGPCESSTTVSFSGAPTRIEVTNTIREGFELTVLPVVGSVRASTCDPAGLKIFANCGPPVNLNERVCVQVTTEMVNNLTQLAFLMTWNPNILRFVEVRNLRNLLGFNQDSFDKSNKDNGFLGLNWQTISNIAQSLPAGAVLFEVCFDVVGLGGDSPFRFTGARPVARVNNQNIGINPSNCAVRVIQPQGVTLRVSDGEAPPGETVCLDFFVSNFENIVSAQFSVAWDFNHVLFREVTNIFAGANMSNFGMAGIDGGSLTFTWNSASPVSLPNGGRIFTLCFEVTGPPKACEKLLIVDLPLKIEIKSAGSNDNNIGLTSQGGDICVLNPNGYTLVIGEEEGFLGDTICVPFKVADFESVTATRFTVNWDPVALDFFELKTSGALNLDPIANFQTGSANVGILTFSWTNVNGASLADSTVLFELCYILRGPKNQCHTVRLNPEAEVTTVQGEGSVQLTPGAVCIKDQLVIENVRITPVSCPQGSDGAVELTVSGGSQVFFNWETSPVQFTNRARNLPIGQVTVVIFDANDPNLRITETFEVPLTEDLPQAIGGEDRVAPCSNMGNFLLQGTGSAGSKFAYSWSTVGGRIIGESNQSTVVGQGPGQYILTVRNNETFCTARDTVNVTAPQTPRAAAGADFLLTCEADTVRLDGAASEQGANITYLWTTSGGAIVPGDETTINPRITEPGTYLLQVKYSDTECSAVDSVVARNGRTLPNANAGNDREIGCTDEFVLLDGSASVNDANVRYEWLDDAGDVLGTNLSLQVSTAGQYTLRAINTTTGCVASDAVSVVPSGDFPVVDLGAEELKLTCQQDTLAIEASVSNAPDFTFEWEITNGGQIAAGTEESLAPSFVAPGIYRLAVTNTANGCSTSQSLEVIDDRAPPEAIAGQGFELTCSENEFTLNGEGSSVGPNISYNWLLNGQNVGRETLQLSISAPGMYYLEVINRDNGCVAIDSVEVTVDASAPQLNLAPASALDCVNDQVTLQAQVSPANPNYEIAWTVAGNQGNILSGANSLVATVNQAGIYRLTVTNPENGCEAIDEVVVDSNADFPVANAGADKLLNCRDSVVILDGSSSSSGARFSYDWNAVDAPGVPEPADAPQTLVAAPGIYELVVTDTENGCISRDTIRVTQDVEAPTVSIAAPEQLSCTRESVSLNAEASLAANLGVEWTGPAGPLTPGANPLTASASEPGRYQVLVRNELNGCTASASVDVEADDSLPVADPQREYILPCPGQALALSGGNSSAGSEISYLWTVVSGGGAIENATTLSPTVTQEGQYQLEVKNNDNGCSATAVVTVTLDPVLVQANAGADMDVCDNSAMLSAELPAGATGLWTNEQGGVLIEMPGNPVSFVDNLRPGDNIFIWTLSRPNCPNYSSDQVVVRMALAPVANNDLATVAAGQTRVEINLTANDLINTSGQWSVSIRANPNLGTLQTGQGGRVTYTPKPGIFGVDEFSYELCNLTCPDLCDSAFVRVNIQVDPNRPGPQLPNAITPNGDGLNDELVFDLIENAFDFWPDNELIIFNRWGDIVYQAKPYTNNWRGTNLNGQELPDGTYYYILRLDIANGVIYKGDVTILKR